MGGITRLQNIHGDMFSFYLQRHVLSGSEKGTRRAVTTPSILMVETMV